MKWIYRLSSVVILMAALSLPFYADYRSGGSFLNLDTLPERLMSALSPSRAEFNGSPVNESSDNNRANSDSEAVQVGVTVYKWQDEHGQWHFSDQAPDRESEKTIVDANELATISAMDPKLIEKTNQGANGDKPMQFTPSTELSLDNATKVFDNAQQAAKMMQQRNEALREIVGDQTAE